MTIGTDYHDVRRAAQQLANITKREIGIEKLDEYGTTKFKTRHLPDEPDRYGWDAMCEIVTPQLDARGRNAREQDAAIRRS